MTTRPTTRNRGLKAGYRSGLEERIGESLRAAGVRCEYESLVIHYRVPERESRYTPDFPLPNGIIVESKGRFLPADRAKHLLIREQHPDLDIRFVFTRSSAPLYKGAASTYADWCAKHGFTYSDKEIPETWIKEPTRHTALRAMLRLARKAAKR